MDDVGAVEAVLEEFLREKAAAALAEGLPGEVPGLLGDFVGAGGKRVRPSLCLLGWRAARGPRGDPRAIRVAASLELFHAFALIHDDLMDHSDTRRGRPTLQHFLTARHQVGRTTPRPPGSAPRPRCWRGTWRWPGRLSSCTRPDSPTPSSRRPWGVRTRCARR
ncbi:polyprenyl synthetase family protein [Streptomyces sp. WAC07149]|uniref:polyprenyl synthetase family protein n=1 Tax=Streptomyces sp. WAC07149 TaxID=2487425 RepID=UPI001C8CFFC1